MISRGGATLENLYIVAKIDCHRVERGNFVTGARKSASIYGVVGLDVLDKGDSTGFRNPSFCTAFQPNLRLCVISCNWLSEDRVTLLVYERPIPLYHFRSGNGQRQRSQLGPDAIS